MAASLTFLKTFTAIACGLLAAVSLVIWTIDPYGTSPLRLPIARPLMDINQRYMYPQVVRSGRYDSALIGTSTSRLLDPIALDAALGGRFANLAMNAATAWEQLELAKLFLRHQPQPRNVVIGLDQMWCLEAHKLERITFRGFPQWMYDSDPLNDLPELVNLKSLEITGRLIAHQLGLAPERIREDGFEVFTPPEQSYDLARARTHLWRGMTEMRVAPVEPPVTLSKVESDALHLPALEWLDDLLVRLPPSTQRMLVFMPVHIAAQPQPGSRAAAIDRECRTRIDALAQRHRAAVVDFAIASPLTSNDANYWDPLHYRLPVAQTIVAALRSVRDGTPAPDQRLFERR